MPPIDPPRLSVLIVEDHRDLRANIGAYLEQRGHQADHAEDGRRALVLAAENRYDVIVLDRMLPDMDGLDVARRLRGAPQGASTGILVLTARDTLEDKLEGFAAGGDDYLVKPFSLAELHARLLALHRRLSGRPDGRLRVADLEFDPDTLVVRRAERPVHLPPTTLRILALLMQNSPRVVTREEIESAIWGDDLPGPDALRAHIHTLRQAIDKPFDRPLLHTVHGVGFRLGADETVAP
ncbi:MAG: DNA-binding response regulator [Gammaproteobacteria bacterium]|nr:MAG: DNA-binding response regulator [Gammaproteobacteria bacterium]